MSAVVMVALGSVGDVLTAEQPGHVTVSMMDRCPAYRHKLYVMASSPCLPGCTVAGLITINGTSFGTTSDGA